MLTNINNCPNSSPIDQPSNNIFICSICFEPLNSRYYNNTTTSCSHTFHSTCINTWVTYSNTCPICRSLITSMNRLYLSGRDE